MQSSHDALRRNILLLLVCDVITLKMNALSKQLVTKISFLRGRYRRDIFALLRFEYHPRRPRGS